MRLIISSLGMGKALSLDILGYHLEISDLDTGSITVVDHEGRLSVCCVESASITDTLQIEPVAVQLDSADISDIAQTDTLPTCETAIDNTSLADISAAETLETDVVDSATVETSSVSPAHELQPDQLFQYLSLLRKQLAAEAKLPPYIIFHDSTLRAMCILLPTDLQQLSSIQGIGKTKLEKYGARFIEAIQQYISGVKEVA